MTKTGKSAVSRSGEASPAVSDLVLRGHSDGIVDVLIEIGQERAKILQAMKAALLRGDDAEALERARELTGLPTRTQTAPDA